jgi:hypothetical protein
MPSIPKNCEPLAADLAKKKELLSDLQEEYGEATGAERTRLFYEIRNLREQIYQTEVSLDQCINPPTPLPDLSPTDVIIRWNFDRVHFDFAVVIHNSGAPTSGPFKITLGVEYYVYSQDPPLDTFHQRDFIFPNYLSINTNDNVVSEYWTNVNFVTRPGSSFASYTFYALIDADDQIAESNKYNNNLQVSKVLKVPMIILPPFVPPRAFF